MHRFPQQQAPGGHGRIGTGPPPCQVSGGALAAMKRRWSRCPMRRGTASPRAGVAAVFSNLEMSLNEGL